MPGRIPPTSQLDWLISTTAMIVLFWSRATRDLLKSFGWGIAALHRLNAATKLPCPRRPPIASSSTRVREVGCRAPTAAKLNGSTKPAEMRIGDLRSARTPHQGQEGKDIVVLDRWAEDRTEGAVSSLARSRPVSYYEGSRSGPAVTAYQHYPRKLPLLARRDEAILSGRPAAEVEAGVAG